MARSGKRPEQAIRLSQLPRALESRFGALASATPDPDRKNAAVALVLREPAPKAASLPPQPERTAPGPAPTPAPDPALGPPDPAAALAPDPPVRECSFLAIRRAESRRDPWSGQMALPGGALDPCDAGLLEAAVRETWEETGLALAPQDEVSEAQRKASVLGRIGCLRPVMSRAPAITIWPFVFRVGADASARVASPEVASVHWFPVAALEDETRLGTHLWRHEGVGYRFPCVRLGGRVIWGLTFRVLMRFLEAA